MGRISRAVMALACLSLVSCGHDDVERQAEARGRSVSGAVPETREEFLAELLPMPFDALVIVHDVRGPAGLHGTLEVLARPGGDRRYNWRLELPVSEQTATRIEGSALVTADVLWSDGASGPIVRARNAGALADAYLAASPQVRSQVIDVVRGWHAELARGRALHPGPADEILGTKCLDTRVAGRRLCVWEETGLVLRDEGPAFRVEARVIEVDPELGERAFDVPVEAPWADVDADAALRSLAAGDVTTLAELARPATWPGSGDLDVEI